MSLKISFSNDCANDKSDYRTLTHFSLKTPKNSNWQGISITHRVIKTHQTPYFWKQTSSKSHDKRSSLIRSTLFAILLCSLRYNCIKSKIKPKKVQN